MTLKFKCPCGQKLAAPIKKMGSITRCPKCQRTIKVPRVKQSVPPAPQLNEPVDHVPKPKRKPKRQPAKQPGQTSARDRKWIFIGSAVAALLLIAGGVILVMQMIGNGGSPEIADRINNTSKRSEEIFDQQSPNQPNTQAGPSVAPPLRPLAHNNNVLKIGLNYFPEQVRFLSFINFERLHQNPDSIRLDKETQEVVDEFLKFTKLQMSDLRFITQGWMSGGMPIAQNDRHLFPHMVVVGVKKVPDHFSVYRPANGVPETAGKMRYLKLSDDLIALGGYSEMRMTKVNRERINHYQKFDQVDFSQFDCVLAQVDVGTNGWNIAPAPFLALRDNKQYEVEVLNQPDLNPDNIELISLVQPGNELASLRIKPAPVSNAAGINHTSSMLNECLASDCWSIDGWSDENKPKPGVAARKLNQYEFTSFEERKQLESSVLEDLERLYDLAKVNSYQREDFGWDICSVASQTSSAYIQSRCRDMIDSLYCAASVRYTGGLALSFDLSAGYHTQLENDDHPETWNLKRPFPHTLIDASRYYLLANDSSYYRPVCRILENLKVESELSLLKAFYTDGKTRDRHYFYHAIERIENNAPIRFQSSGIGSAAAAQDRIARNGERIDSRRALRWFLDNEITQHHHMNFWVIAGLLDDATCCQDADTVLRKYLSHEKLGPALLYAYRLLYSRGKEKMSCPLQDNTTMRFVDLMRAAGYEEGIRGIYDMERVDLAGKTYAKTTLVEMALANGKPNPFLNEPSTEIANQPASLNPSLAKPKPTRPTEHNQNVLNVALQYFPEQVRYVSYVNFDRLNAKSDPVQFDDQTQEGLDKLLKLTQLKMTDINFITQGWMSGGTSISNDERHLFPHLMIVGVKEVPQNIRSIRRRGNDYITPGGMHFHRINKRLFALGNRIEIAELTRNSKKINYYRHFDQIQFDQFDCVLARVERGENGWHTQPEPFVACTGNDHLHIELFESDDQRPPLPGPKENQILTSQSSDQNNQRLTQVSYKNESGKVDMLEPQLRLALATHCWAFYESKRFEKPSTSTLTNKIRHYQYKDRDQRDSFEHDILEQMNLSYELGTENSYTTRKLGAISDTFNDTTSPFLLSHSIELLGSLHNERTVGILGSWSQHFDIRECYRTELENDDRPPTEPQQRVAPQRLLDACRYYLETSHDWRILQPAARIVENFNIKSDLELLKSALDRVSGDTKERLQRAINRIENDEPLQFEPIKRKIASANDAYLLLQERYRKDRMTGLRWLNENDIDSNDFEVLKYLAILLDDGTHCELAESILRKNLQHPQMGTSLNHGISEVYRDTVPREDFFVIRIVDLMKETGYQEGLFRVAERVKNDPRLKAYVDSALEELADQQLQANQ